MFELLFHVAQYVGKSSDKKPVSAPVNSLLLELDTGIIRYFDPEDTTTDDHWPEVGGAADESI